jgi:hypothetical protein
MTSTSGTTWAERFPNLLCPSILSVPSSVPRQTERLHWAVSSSSALAFPISVQGLHLQTHALQFQRGCVTRLQSHFMVRPGKVASPAPARAFTFELSPS